MKLFFNEEQMKQEKNKIEVKEDELVLFGESIEGEGKNYIITGKAIIEGETYHDFQVEFELTEVPEKEEIDYIMDIDWEWYDYLC